MWETYIPTQNLAELCSDVPAAAGYCVAYCTAVFSVVWTAGLEHTPSNVKYFEVAPDDERSIREEGFRLCVRVGRLCVCTSITRCALITVFWRLFTLHEDFVPQRLDRSPGDAPRSATKCVIFKL